MSNIISMNNAHDEKISFCPASGSTHWNFLALSISSVEVRTTYHHLQGLHPQDRALQQAKN